MTKVTKTTLGNLILVDDRSHVDLSGRINDRDCFVRPFDAITGHDVMFVRHWRMPMS